MSGTQVSSFTNQLFDPMMARRQTYSDNQNQLATAIMPYQIQEAQQKVGEADIEMMARASQGLLLLPDEASRAAAYPAEVSRLQSMGFAKNAPAQYPGEAALRRVANMGVSLADQYKLGLVTPPGLADALKGITAPLPGQPGYGGGSSGAAPGVAMPARGGGGPGATAQLPPAYLQHFRDAAAETGLPMDLLIAQARQESSFNPNAKGGAGEIGLFQIKPSTAQSPGFGLTGVDPATLAGPDNVRNNILFGARYLRARMGGGDPNDPRVQAAGLAGYNGGGDPNYVANVFRYRPGLAPSDPQRQIATYTPNVPAAPGGTTPPPGTTQAADLTGPRPLPSSTFGPSTPFVTPESLANTPAPYQVAGAVQPPPAGATGAPAAPQPGTPQPTAPAALPLSGVQSEQYQRAMAIQRQIDALTPYAHLPAAQAKIAQLQAEQKLALQADVWVRQPDGTFRNALTGEPKSAPELQPHYQYDPTRGTDVDTTGTHPAGATPRPETYAMQTIAYLAPKIANGTATPQEQATYASAAEIYRQPQIHADPITKALVRINSRELPEGMPEPPVIGGGWPARSPGSAQNLTPGQSLAQQAAEPKLGEDYATVEKKAYDSAQGTLGMLVSANNAAEVMNRVPGSWTATGSGANFRLDLAKQVNQALGLFGVGPVVDPAKIAEWETLNKQTKLMGMQVINSYFGGSREAASIIQGATGAVPNSENTYLGFRMVSSGIEQTLMREMDKYQFKGQQLAQGKPLSNVDAEFNASHPVVAYTARAIANALPDDIVAHLTAHPDTVAAFDKHFGNGIGEFILKGGRTHMGVAGG